MRILYVSSSDDIAGGEIHLLNLMKGMVEKGEEVLLACRHNSQLLNKSHELDVKVKSIPLRGSLDFYSAFQLRKISKENDIDILHAHLGRDYIPAGLSLFRGSGKPMLVLTRHIMIKPGSSFLHGFVYRNLSRFIGVSQSVCSIIKDLPGIKPDKVMYIPNGIDVERFQKATRDMALFGKFDIPENAPVIGVVGKLSPHKGQADLINAAPEIINACPDVHFIFIGDAMMHQKDYSHELHNLTEELKIGENVHFAGFQSNIPGILKSLTISSVPSWEEPFGLTIIESMAAGIPVVATNSAGANEIIDDGVNGSLAEPRNPSSLAGAIIALLEDREKCNKISLAGLETVKERFTIENMVDRTRSLYKEVLEDLKS